MCSVNETTQLELSELHEAVLDRTKWRRMVGRQVALDKTKWRRMVGRVARWRLIVRSGEGWSGGSPGGG